MGMPKNFADRLIFNFKLTVNLKQSTYLWEMVRKSMYTDFIQRLIIIVLDCRIEESVLQWIKVIIQKTEYIWLNKAYSTSSRKELLMTSEQEHLRLRLMYMEELGGKT